MKNILALLNLAESPSLGELTQKRSFGSVTFLGRYALSDITLSNFTNSSIDHMSIIADQFPSSMRNHIRTGSVFISNTKAGSIDVISATDSEPKARKRRRSDLSILKSNINSYSYMEFIDHVIVAPAHLLMNFDFTRLIKYHGKIDADITVVYQTRDDLDHNFLNNYLVEVNKNGKITSLKLNKGEKKEGNVSLQTYIFKVDVFKRMVLSHERVEKNIAMKEMIKYYVENRRFNVQGYSFPKSVFPIFNLQDYINVSFSLLDYETRKLLFMDDWPTFTTTHNTPPTLYGARADVKNSFIANGARIYGKVTNSIISRDVMIGDNSEVNNCIIFTSTEVYSGSRLNYVLTDKSVLITDNVHLEGRPDEFVIIKQGNKI